MYYDSALDPGDLAYYVSSNGLIYEDVIVSTQVTETYDPDNSPPIAVTVMYQTQALGPKGQLNGAAVFGSLGALIAYLEKNVQDTRP